MTAFLPIFNLETKSVLLINPEKIVHLRYSISQVENTETYLRTLAITTEGPGQFQFQTQNPEEIKAFLSAVHGPAKDGPHKASLATLRLPM